MSKNVLPMFSSKSFIASSLTFTAILLWGTYPVKTKTLNLKRYMHLMFIVALFTTARTWKQSKCPSADEWI